LPESRHRRKGRQRPRQRHVAGPPRKPDPSPTWIPITGLALILAGIGLVIANYTLGFLQRNWLLWVGFAMMAVGFGFLMRYR
jgi:hypothetical protein